MITVCDSAAAESCPIFFGDFVRTHWGLPDPAAITGSDDDKRAAFARAHAVIGARLRALLDLPAAAWNERTVLQDALDRIGAIVPDDVGGDVSGGRSG